ncbi:hypothetical protein Dsin_002724, partial [Dipteronia sinensis]
MDIDSEEEIEEQIVKQAIRDEIEFNKVVLTVARATIKSYGLTSTRGVRLEEAV